MPVESGESFAPPLAWDFVPDKKKDGQQPSTSLIWEILEDNDSRFIPSPQAEPKSKVSPPTTAKDVAALRNTIPLEPSDYQPLLRLSPLVPKANTLPVEQWRIAFGTISSFESDTGTGNQNYSVNLDIGLNDSLLLSLFVSQADDPLNAPLTGFKTQPGNF